MNNHQLLALEQPWRDNEGGDGARFAWPNGNFVLMLRVNKSTTHNDGLPVWHVTIRHRTGENIRLWKKKRMKAAIALAMQALQGVGKKSMWVFCARPPGDALHIQRPLLHKETLILPDSWRRMPAKNSLGPIHAIDCWKPKEHRLST